MMSVDRLFSEGLGGKRDKLFNAAVKGDIEHVRYLLSCDHSPNVKDFDGDTVRLLLRLVERPV